MNKLKQILGNWRVILLLAAVLIAVVAISPQFSTEGVTVRTVLKDSAAANSIPNPMLSPEPNSLPTSREVIKSINNRPILDTDDYYEFIDGLEINRSLLIKTDQGTYRLKTVAEYEITVLNETETITYVDQVFDNETNTTSNVTKTKVVNKTIETFVGMEDIGLKVYEAPSNNIQKGLDLAGGTRVILSPEEEVSSEDMGFILENIRQRLNVYGLSDITVRQVKDFTGETYVLVEIAGASQDEVIDLLAKQGKFEAKVGDIVVFRGGQDIVYVDRTATGSGLDPQRGCQESGDGEWFCGFRFAISLSPEAADKQAEATGDLEVLFSGISDGGYLSENLTLYLDDELVDELRIGESLKGNSVTDISISGSGYGASRDAATKDALDNMKQLQTVMQTGSLPVKLEIIESQAISPVLGEEFIKNVLLVGLLALAAVVVVVTIRYKKAAIAVPVIITMVSEVILILGFAVLAKWQLDLAAIAGILIAVGTGVDDQIVIIDETLQGGKRVRSAWKSRLKKAFFIIMTAYFTTVVAMIPLLGSGAGLLKGFALTTIAGVTLGVFITRPAFAKIFEVLVSRKEKDDEDD